MKKWMILLVTLVPLAVLSGCNQPKPVKLDYTEKMEKGLYDPQGLPGESHIGAPPEDFKHHGYKPGEEPADQPAPGDAKDESRLQPEEEQETAGEEDDS